MEKSSFREKDVPEESRLLEDFDGKTKARPVKVDSTKSLPTFHVNFSALS